jgi:hypothetical protein
MMAKMTYVLGPEIGVVWMRVGAPDERLHRCEVRVRYQGKEIGYAESVVLSREASPKECTRAARDASLAAIRDAIDFIGVVKENADGITFQVSDLSRGIDDTKH